MQLHGLGFQHKEIADLLGLTQLQVSYHLHEFKNRCLKEDP
ncbi:MAG: hypothetical protein U9M95_05595 [Candidatus Altiarchaeota archaeon]|nr:hypothetical protein [Candidatus Altiarchaeota archaeon]